jgi:hypothetical protein
MKVRTAFDQGLERQMNRKTLSLIGLTILLILLMARCKPAPEVRTAPLDPTPRLVIMSAFEPEMEKLRTEAEITDTFVINGRNYYVGQLAGNGVVILLSGVSMVNAAMTTQTVIDHFDVEGIVFSGIAGGVNPSLNVGDVVVPAQWGQYQEQLFARETAQGWDTGRYSAEFGNFGICFPKRSPSHVKTQRPTRRKNASGSKPIPRCWKSCGESPTTCASTSVPLGAIAWQTIQR